MKDFSGNRGPVAKSHEQLFGGPAYVACGLPGDGLWTDVGLVMRVEIDRMNSTQNNQNEVGQTMGQSSFQAFKGVGITMTLRQFQAEFMTALYPGIATYHAETATRNEGMGHSTTPSVITPIGLHIRPQYSYGAEPNDGYVWWIPAAIAGPELGTFTFKKEESEESTEDYTLTFKGSLITEDYTPGTPQTIAEDGQIFYRGDTRHIVTNTWETGLPFGNVKGTPGRVESYGVKASTLMDTSATVEWTAPGSKYIENGYPITQYNIKYRPVTSTAAFSTETLTTLTTLEQALTNLTASTTYEIRISAESSAGEGQQACFELTTTS